MKEYRYKLDNTAKKFRCPNCGKKTYVRYKDYLEEEYLAYEYGRCDREIKCGYFNKYIGNKNAYKIIPHHLEAIKMPNYHPYSLVEEGKKDRLKNALIQHLIKALGREKTDTIIERYQVGNATDWYNGTIFWQIDHLAKVHAGKIIRYNNRGKRFGSPYWVHSYLKKKKKIESFNLLQCLFGLHLTVEDKEKPIAIVESEKTACVMSVICPDNIWLATGSLNGLNKRKILPIRNRKIILYPDSGIANNGKTPFEKWASIATQLRMEGFDIETSKILEEKTTQEEKRQGYDLADYFI